MNSDWSAVWQAKFGPLCNITALFGNPISTHVQPVFVIQLVMAEVLWRQVPQPHSALTVFTRPVRCHGRRGHGLLSLSIGRENFLVVQRWLSVMDPMLFRTSSRWHRIFLNLYDWMNFPHLWVFPLRYRNVVFILQRLRWLFRWVWFCWVRCQRVVYQLFLNIKTAQTVYTNCSNPYIKINPASPFLPPRLWCPCIHDNHEKQLS